jgi:cobalt-zinc-cadmium efflux system outer membrane protein
MARNLFVWLFILLVPAESAPLQTSGDVAEALTLDRCISLSLSHNPLWLSSESDYQASLARVRQAKALPQPSLSYDSDLQPRLLDFGRSEESYFGVNETVEFPGKRTVRGRIATLESGEVLADRDSLKLDLTFQVTEAFYAVLLAEEKVKYDRQDVELARDFLGKSQVKYAAGDVPKMEVVRAGVEAARAATAVTLAENDVLLAKARLNFLLGRGKLEPLEVRGELKRPAAAIDPAYLGERARIARPEMRKMSNQIRKEGLAKTAAALDYLPDFDLSLSRHRLAGLQPTWDFTISFPIPLFFWQPLRGRIAEAEANLASLRDRNEHLANMIGLEVEEAGLAARTAESQIALFEKDILTQAEEAYNLYLFSFQEGEIGGIELIEARRTLIETHKAYADALYNYRVALAALEKAVGEPLQGVGHE